MSTDVPTTVPRAVRMPRGIDDAGPSPDDAAVTEAFAERLFGSALGALDLFAIGLGARLGLYRAVHEQGPTTSTELAARAGIAERYAREWLEQQAVTGILTVSPDPSAGRRRYALPAALVPALLDPTHPAYVAPLAAFVSPLGAVFDRPAFTHDPDGWLHAVPAFDERARRPEARILDAACGAGWSTQGLARRYPRTLVHGVDIDDTSIALARREVAGSDLARRVQFDVADLAGICQKYYDLKYYDLKYYDLKYYDLKYYDLATMFAALHDLSHPVEPLTAIRESPLPGGVLLLADENAGDEFTAPGDPVERFFYGASLLVCLPGSLADSGVGTGTAIRPSTVRRYAAEAGFASGEVAGIEHLQLRFYVLRTTG